MTPGQLLARLKKGAAPPGVAAARAGGLPARRIKQALAANGAREPRLRSTISRGDAGRSAGRCPFAFAIRRRPPDLGRRTPKPHCQEAAPPRKTGKANRAAPRERFRRGPLADYLRDPTPGMVLVFEAVRFDFEGDDKRKLERVAKFYSAIPDVVELRRFAAHEARREAEVAGRERRLAPGRGRARPAGGSAGRRCDAASPWRSKNWLCTPAAARWAWTISPNWCRMPAPPTSLRW